MWHILSYWSYFNTLIVYCYLGVNYDISNDENVSAQNAIRPEIC